MSSDPRWQVLEDARQPLIDALASHGVIAVRFVAAFPDLEGVGVWLCTQSDEQRDRLGSKLPCLGEVREVLRHVGFPEGELAGISTVAQSQETVDRSYEGSWFYAMR